MTGLGDEILWPLLRATVLLAVSAVLVQGLILGLRPTSPRIQRAGWFLVLLQGVILFHLPVRVAWLEGRPPQPLPSTVESHSGMPEEAPPAVALPPPSSAVEPPATDLPAVDLPRPTVPPEPAESFPWASLAVIVWLAGVVCLPLWTALAYVRFLWRLRFARPAPESWLREWQTLLAAEGVRRAGDCPDFRARDCPDFRAAGDCPDFRAAKMGLSPSRGAAIPLRVTDDVGPALCWTPRGYRVFVPERIWAELSASQRAAVLRHELAHLRRGDLWKTLFARLLALPHWFNPFAWWAVHRFAECAEWACDQSAAGSRHAAATDYAKALLRLGTARPRSPSCATAIRGGSLFVRIRRVISAQLSEDSVMKKATILLMAAALVALNVVRVELVAKEPGGGDLMPMGAANQGGGERTDRYGDLLPAGAQARLGTLRWRNIDTVTYVSFSPDGKTLVTASKEPTVIRLWDVRTGKLVQEYWAGRHAEIAFSRDWKRLAVGGDRDIALVDWPSGQQVVRYDEIGPREGPWKVAFSADGKSLAAVSARGAVRLWELATARELFRAELKPEVAGLTTCLAFSPNGETLAVGDYREAIRLWNLEAGSKPAVIQKAHATEVMSLVFTRDGRHLISSGGRSVRTARTVFSEIRVWEVRTGMQGRELVAEEPDAGRCLTALSKDGKMLTSAHLDKIRLWDLASGKPVRLISRHASLWDLRAARTLAFSPDGTTLAVATDNVVSLWDVATGAPLASYPEAHAAKASAVATSSVGNLVATGSSDQTVRVWDPATGKQLRELAFKNCRVASVALSPDGQSLAACGSGWGPSGFSGAVNTWDVSSGRVLSEVNLPAPATTIAYSADGKALAVATADAGAPDGRPLNCSVMHLFDVAGTEIAKLTGNVPGERINDMAFSRDGRRLTSVSGGFSTKAVIRSWDLSAPNPRSESRTLAESDSWSYCKAFSPDEKHLATGLTSDHAVLIYDLEAGEEAQRLKIGPCRSARVAYSPDGGLLATACNGPFVQREVLGDNHRFEEEGLSAAQYTTKVYLWNTRTGKKTGSFVADSAEVSSMAFCADGKSLITGLTDGTALVWDVAAAAGKSGP